VVPKPLLAFCAFHRIIEEPSGLHGGLEAT